MIFAGETPRARPLEGLSDEALEGVNRLVAPHLLTNRSDGLPPTSPSVPVATTSPLDGLDLQAEELERHAQLTSAGNGLLLIEASGRGASGRGWS